jgi:hypothetical protein
MYCCLLIRNNSVSTLQFFTSRRPCAEFKIVKFKSFAYVRTTRSFHLNSHCVQDLLIFPGCIRSDVSATRPDTIQCSTSKRISFPNTDMGRQLQPFERRGYSVRTLSFIRQDLQKICNRPDASLYCLDAQSLL